MNSKSILLIDDEESIRDIIKLSLEEEGFEIHLASNGFEGIELLKKIPPPGLILVDYMMPGMDGREFVATLKQDKDLANLNVPIVLITAFSQPKIDGVQGILYKPMDYDSLIKTAHDYCH